MTCVSVGRTANFRLEHLIHPLTQVVLTSFSRDLPVRGPLFWTSPARCSILSLHPGFTQMSQTTAQGSRKRLTPLGIIFAVLGLALFAYFVKRAGIGQIV